MGSTRPYIVRPLYPSNEVVSDFFEGQLSAPITVDWEITMRCNLRCIHCCFAAGEPRPEELSTDEAIWLVDDLVRFGVFRLGFTGGEPLMRPDFLDIAAYAHDKGLELALNTNGMLIDRKRAQRIAKLFIEAQISLDGARPQTHDFIRARDGAFNETLRGIRELKEAGTVVAINTTLMRPNQREILDILFLAIELGADVYRVIPVRLLGRATENLLIPMAELVETYKTLENIRSAVGDRIHLQLTTVPTMLGKFLEDGYACPAAITKCCVDPQGNVKPCDAFDLFYGGNIRERSLKEIWLHSPEFQAFRRSILDIAPAPCRMCAFGPQCRGGCKGLAYLQYGTLNRPDPQCVEARIHRESGTPSEEGRFQ